MLMYRTVYRRTGEHIFNLFKKLKDLVHSEPVDQISGHSRMTLSEQYLLRVININTNQLSITVLHHEGGEPQFIQVLIARINNCPQIPYEGIFSNKFFRFPDSIVTQSIKSKNAFWTRFIGT